MGKAFFYPLLIGVLAIFVISTITVAWFVLIEEPPMKHDAARNHSIAILTLTQSVALDENIQSFLDTLAQQGLVEGENLTVFRADANGQEEKLVSNVHFALNKNVDLLFTVGTSSTLTAQSVLNANEDNTPIVFSVVTTPVLSGVVNSMTAPGKNTTGSSIKVPMDLQVTNFLRAIPNAINFVVINTGSTAATMQLNEFKRVVSPSSFSVTELTIDSISEITPGLEGITTPIDAIYLPCDALIVTGADQQVISFANKHKIPVISCGKSSIERGALIGTVADIAEAGILAGERAVMILDGAPAGEISVGSVARPKIFINQTTAQKLNIELPSSITTIAENFINQGGL